MYDRKKVPEYLDVLGKTIDITEIPYEDRKRLFLDMRDIPESQLEQCAEKAEKAEKEEVKQRKLKNKGAVE